MSPAVGLFSDIAPVAPPFHYFFQRRPARFLTTPEMQSIRCAWRLARLFGLWVPARSIAVIYPPPFFFRGTTSVCHPCAFRKVYRDHHAPSTSCFVLFFPQTCLSLHLFGTPRTQSPQFFPIRSIFLFGLANRGRAPCPHFDPRLGSSTGDIVSGIQTTLPSLYLGFFFLEACLIGRRAGYSLFTELCIGHFLMIFLSSLTTSVTEPRGLEVDPIWHCLCPGGAPQPLPGVFF